MSSLHPDSAAIDRIGLPAILDHFEITRQAAHYWRRRGVPKQHRKSLVLLADSLRIEVPELRKMRDQLPPESGQPNAG